MPSTLPADLLERVVSAIEEGASRREEAHRFNVCPARAVRWHEAFVQEGRTRAKPRGGDQRSQAIKAPAELTLETLRHSPTCSPARPAHSTGSAGSTSAGK